MAKPRPKRVGYSVFVSHATPDKWIAVTFCEKLEAIGVATFRDDRDLNGGDDIPDAIRQAILDADELLVLLTPESVNRRWVLMEIGAAWVRNMRILGVRCHVEFDVIPDMLKSKKVYSINDFDRLLDEVHRRAAK